MTKRPPQTIKILWCPVCGRDDRYTDLKKGAGRHFADGLKCHGAPEEIIYYPVVAPDPVLITGTASMRATVEVAVTVSPPPPHLPVGEGTAAARAGRVFMFAAQGVEELAEMIEAYADLLGRQVAEQLAAHPRPEPIEGWPE